MGTIPDQLFFGSFVSKHVGTLAAVCVSFRTCLRCTPADLSLPLSLLSLPYAWSRCLCCFLQFSVSGAILVDLWYDTVARLPGYAQSVSVCLIFSRIIVFPRDTRLKVWATPQPVNIPNGRVPESLDIGPVDVPRSEK